MAGAALVVADLTPVHLQVRERFERKMIKMIKFISERLGRKH